MVNARDSEVKSAWSGGICEKALGERIGKMACSQMVISSVHRLLLRCMSLELLCLTTAFHAVDMHSHWPARRE